MLTVFCHFQDKQKNEKNICIFNAIKYAENACISRQSSMLIMLDFGERQSSMLIMLDFGETRFPGFVILSMTFQKKMDFPIFLVSS
jgi:hypothetical protein